MWDFPMTRRDAEKFRYNRWAGNPAGNAYQADRCAWEAAIGGRSMMYYQCTRKPVAGPENLYCKQHAKKVPVGEASR